MLKFNKVRTLAAGSLAVTLVGLTVTGCSGGKEKDAAAGSPSASSAQASAAPKEPTPINIMFTLFVAEPPKKDNEAQKIIEEYTNTKLNITWAPAASYEDKVNATIASGELPHVMLTNDKTPSILNAAKSGAFWEIGPYLKDFPNLAKMNQQVFENIKVDGKIYGLYRARPVPRSGPIYRQDWMNKLNISEPKTVEQLVEMLRSFTTKDPDGNGKADTYGLIDDKNLSSFSPIFVYMGGTPGFEEKNGKFTPEFMTEPYKKTLDLFRDLYKEKVINQDFAALSDKFTMFNKGVGGLHFGALTDVVARHNDLFKIDPNAKMDILTRISGPAGTRTLATTGYSNTFVFPKSSVKTEQELKALLGFFDKLNDQAMVDLVWWGIEGTHYKKEDGKPVWTNQNDYTATVRPFSQMVLLDDMKSTLGKVDPIVEKVFKTFEDNESIAIPNPSWPLFSATNTEKGNELTKIISDARIKYIMGATDEKGWNDAVEQWKKQGGLKIIEEYEADFAKLKK